MSLCLCLQGGERSFPKLNILGLSRGGSIPKIGQFEYLGQNGRPLMGPQMEMSSLVLTVHNFGVPNFDPYPFEYLDKFMMNGFGDTLHSEKPRLV